MQELIGLLVYFLNHETGLAVDDPLANPSSLVLNKPLILICSYDHVKDLNPNTTEVTYIDRIRLQKLKIQDGDKNQQAKAGIWAIVYSSAGFSQLPHFSVNKNNRNLSVTFPGVGQGQGQGQHSESRQLSRNASIVLTIENAECQDVGLYLCEIEIGGQIFSRHFYVDTAANSPVLSHNFSSKTLEVGSKTVVTCKTNSSDSSMKLGFKLRLPKRNEVIDLPVSTAHKGFEHILSSNWPEQPIVNRSTRVVGPCPGIEYREYSSSMSFTVRWTFIRKSEIFCTAARSSNEKSQNPLLSETFEHSYASLKLWNHSSLFLSKNVASALHNGSEIKPTNETTGTEPTVTTSPGADEGPANATNGYTVSDITSEETPADVDNNQGKTNGTTDSDDGFDKDSIALLEIYLILTFLSMSIFLLCFLFVGYVVNRKKRPVRKKGNRSTVSFNTGAGTSCTFDDDPSSATSVSGKSATTASSVDTGILTEPTHSGDPFQDALTSTRPDNAIVAVRKKILDPRNTTKESGAAASSKHNYRSTQMDA